MVHDGLVNPGWHALRYSEGRDAAPQTGTTPFGVPQGVPPGEGVACHSSQRGPEKPFGASQQSSHSIAPACGVVRLFGESFVETELVAENSGQARSIKPRGEKAAF